MAKKIEPVEGRLAVVVSVSGGGEISPNTACRAATLRQLEKKGYKVFYEKMVVMPSNLIGFDESLSAMVLHATPVIVDKVVAELMVGKWHRTAPLGLIGLLLNWVILKVSGQEFLAGNLRLTTNVSIVAGVKKCAPIILKLLMAGILLEMIVCFVCVVFMAVRKERLNRDWANF